MALTDPDETGGRAVSGGHRPASAGRLLVATPILGDPQFDRSVVYLLEHGADGTLGVIVNRPSHTPVGHVLPDWQEAVSGPSVVFGGGPVQPDGALCLGLFDGQSPGVRHVVGQVAMVDLDGDASAVTALASSLRIFAGHAGWGGGQLAGEIAQGAWWVLEGSPADLFSVHPELLRTQVLRRQGYPLSLYAHYPPELSLN